MPILTCIFFTFNWLTLTSEMHFVRFHPEVASCLLSKGKRKYAPLGMRLIWKYIRNYFLVYQLLSHFLSYLQNYKEFKAKILDLQPEKYGLSLDIKKCTTSGWALGDENVIGIRAFNITNSFSLGQNCTLSIWACDLEHRSSKIDSIHTAAIIELKQGIQSVAIDMHSFSSVIRTLLQNGYNANRVTFVDIHHRWTYCMPSTNHVTFSALTSDTQIIVLK